MNPMDDGLRGGQIRVGQNGAVNTNVQGGAGGQQHRQEPMRPYVNPVPNNYPENPGNGQPQGRQQQYQQEQQPQRRQPGKTGDWSSIDEFMSRFYDNGQGGQGGQQNMSHHGGQETGQGGNGNGQGNGQGNGNGQQSQQEPEKFDLMSLTRQNFDTVANGMDFTQGLPDEVLNYFQPDENGQTPNLMKGIMMLSNHVARGAYSNSLAGAGRVAGLGLQHYDSQFKAGLPQMLRRDAATQAVQSLGVHEALMPSINAMVDKVLANNPNASPELIHEMVTGFVDVLRSNGQGNGAGNGADTGDRGLGTLFDI